MRVPLLPAGQGDEMPFSHPVNVPIWCSRALVGAVCYPLL